MSTNTKIDVKQCAQLGKKYYRALVRLNPMKKSDVKAFDKATEKYFNAVEDLGGFDILRKYLEETGADKYYIRVLEHPFTT